MNPEDPFPRYQELQAYVGWTEEDARRVHAVANLVEPHLRPLIDDFYAEIQRHPNAVKVITGGQQQIERLKGTLTAWVRELFSGRYDKDYVARRWRIGWRHVEIGLDQVYTNVALSRLRTGLKHALQENWKEEPEGLLAVVRSLNKLLDLDLAIIEDAYQAEYLSRLQRNERLAAIGQVVQAKERSEAAFRTLVEAAPCMVVILRPDQSVSYFSPYAEELTGYSAKSVLGNSYASSFLPEEYQSAFADAQQRVLSGRPVHGYESPIVCKDGTWRWIIWNAQRLDYEGAPAVLVVGQDITSRKQAQDQALQAERLAAIGQMMAGLAHESGNALARSQACLEMLAQEVEDRPEALDLVGRVQKAQLHLQQLQDEVRGYAAPLKLEREIWDLSGVWRQAWTNLEVTRKGRQTSLRENTNHVDLKCSVDNFRLEQVFRNIFDNSLAACGDPVMIEIVCAETKIKGRPGLEIAVRDNGPGLSQEQKQRIFDPFFTTKTKGTGLGMAIAERIVEAHGGRIGVGQSVGCGAEIIITLPRESPWGNAYEPVPANRGGRRRS
jgi:PAS domain S-box-containing protein